MFTEEINKIENVSAEVKNAIARKSAQTLPNSPSAHGYSAEEIKRRFYQPILDAANSALAEIDRVVNEVNTALGQIDTNMDTFLERSKINEPYKVTLNNETWKYNDDLDLYELLITKEEHKIENHEEIGVDMFLLDGQGNYIKVNQFEVLPDSTVRCFNENNGAGYVSVYTKREGYVWGNNVLDVDHIIGIGKVAKTNDYNDLNNLPDLEIMIENEKMISRIISGEQSVAMASYSSRSGSATYANTSGSADSATKAQNATNAVNDEFGVNISNSYCKKNGNYDGLKSGKSAMADCAKCDEEGVNIKDNYSKQNGSYPLMSVGNATKADKASKADVSDKASQDGNGANIAETYATKTGNYEELTVGKANEAESAKKLSSGGIIENGVTATTQPVEDDSDKVATTAFVKEALGKILNIDEGNIMFGGDVAGKIYRQANIVYGYLDYEVDIPNGQNGNMSFTFPKKFAPASDVYILDGTLFQDDIADDRAYLKDFKARSSANIEAYARNTQWVHTKIKVLIHFGYKV